jgi:hypothetical protein
VESLLLVDVPGSEEEGVGVGVELDLGVSEVGGGTLLVLEGLTLVGVLVGGTMVVEGWVSIGGSEVDVSGLVTVSDSVSVSVSESDGVELGPSEVELSSRFASCKMVPPRGASLRRTASSALWFVALPWQGSRVEATPISASMHTSMIMVVRRAVVILLVESGRCWLSVVVGWAPAAVFSRASTGRRDSEDGDLPSLSMLKTMTEDPGQERNRWIVC